MNTKIIKFQDEGFEAYELPEQAVEIFRRFYESGKCWMGLCEKDEPTHPKYFGLRIDDLKEPRYYKNDLCNLVKYNWLIFHNNEYHLTRYGVSKYLEWKKEELEPISVSEAKEAIYRVIKEK